MPSQAFRESLPFILRWEGGFVDHPDDPGGRTNKGVRDDTARVVETTTGKDLLRVTHEATVGALAFSPDGRYLATGSGDNTARVVESMTGKEIIRLPHDDAVFLVAFSPDGRVLYIGTKNEKVATLLQHLLRAEDLIAATCARLTRNLTAEEWTRYLGDIPYRMTCDKIGL